VGQRCTTPVQKRHDRQAASNYEGFTNGSLSIGRQLTSIVAGNPILTREARFTVELTGSQNVKRTCSSSRRLFAASENPPPPGSRAPAD
jgi:hypothetical protein